MQRVKYACEMNAVVVALISQTGPREMSAFGMIFIHMQEHHIGHKVFQIAYENH